MGKIYIYKYTNKFNGHAYIGKTNNVARRQREHKSNAYNKSNEFYNSLWCQKIRQYGYENFDFEILEETDTEHWKEREKYWIKYYNTFEGVGYNRDGGGDGEDNRIKSLNESQLDEIIELLKNSTKTQKEIANEYSISETLVSNINTGLSYKLNEEQYPIRKNYKTIDDYSDLIRDLKETTIPMTKLQEKYGYSYNTIKHINEGIMFKDDNIVYPIRKLNEHQARAILIKNYLKTTNLNFEKIAQLTDCKADTVSRINRGRSHYDENEHYPLRNPVSTISLV